MCDLYKDSEIDTDGFLASVSEFLDGKIDSGFRFYKSDTINNKVNSLISDNYTNVPDARFDEYINLINGMDYQKFLTSFIDPDANNNAKYNDGDSLEVKILKAFRLDFDINKKSDFTNVIDCYFGDGVSSLAKVAEVLNVLGLKRSASTLVALLAKLSISEIRSPIDDELKKRVAISEKNRAAGKGNINKNKELVVNIAKNTWDQYPNASLGGLRDEIYEYLTRNNITSRPSMATINDWLKKSEFRPMSQKTNRNFVLITD
ncbi:TPA: hypothetical protein ACSTL5_004840 [Serratia fonticola]